MKNGNGVTPREDRPLLEVTPRVDDTKGRGGDVESEEDAKKRLTIAKIVVGITMREGGNFKAEESVYGAALVLPQAARTVGWAKTMKMLAFRSFLFLFLNFFIQSYLLKMVAKEQNVMNLYAGQMHLCDFGAFVDDCPGPGCQGPGGTEITPPRRYNFETWMNRIFLRDSLKLVFPDRLEDIEASVDAGEFGIESYWCRLTCCFLFTIGLMGELTIVIKMANLIWSVPTATEPWIVDKDPEETEDMEVGALEAVQWRIAGMPLQWKVINAVCIVLPKAFLFKLTAETGIMCLMETSGIQNIIMNSVGLAFILNLDELIYVALMSEDVQTIVRLCEDYPLYSVKTSCVGDVSLLSDEEVIERYNQSQTCLSFGYRDLKALLPLKLCTAMVLTAFLVIAYYQKNCKVSEEGRFVSVDMYLPKDVVYGWLQAFWPSFFPEEKLNQTFWQMPKE